MGTDDNFLSRWSRRKHLANAGRAPAEAEPSPAEPVPPPAAVPAAPVIPAAPAARSPAAPATSGREPLPPVESLTSESDFTRFMAPDVDGDVRRNALKTLFSDPRFNVMDMMDVYVDDYSKPDPLPESWLGKLEQMSRLGDRAGRDREEEARRKAEKEAADAAATASAVEKDDAVAAAPTDPAGTEVGSARPPADCAAPDGIAADAATPDGEGGNLPTNRG
jgi:hypothetical protein